MMLWHPSFNDISSHCFSFMTLFTGTSYICLRQIWRSNSWVQARSNDHWFKYLLHEPRRRPSASPKFAFHGREGPDSSSNCGVVKVRRNHYILNSRVIGDQGSKAIAHDGSTCLTLVCLFNAEPLVDKKPTRTLSLTVFQARSCPWKRLAPWFRFR